MGRIIEADRSGGRDGLIGDKGKSFEGFVDGQGHGHGHEQIVGSSSLSGNVAPDALARDIHRITRRSKAFPNAPNGPTGPSAPEADQPPNDDDVEHGFVDHDVDDIAHNPDTHIDTLICLFPIY
jgi:hypothetical protein